MSRHSSRPLGVAEWELWHDAPQQAIRGAPVTFHNDSLSPCIRRTGPPTNDVLPKVLRRPSRCADPSACGPTASILERLEHSLLPGPDSRPPCNVGFLSSIDWSFSNRFPWRLLSSSRQKFHSLEPKSGQREVPGYARSGRCTKYPVYQGRAFSLNHGRTPYLGR